MTGGKSLKSRKAWKSRKSIRDKPATLNEACVRTLGSLKKSLNSV